MRYEPQQPRAAGPQPASMNLAAVYLSGWRRMFDSLGTSSRTEFWVFLPVTLVILPAIGFVVGASIYDADDKVGLAGIAVLAYVSAAFLASLMLTVRRVREATNRGWFTALLLYNPLLIIAIACCPPYDRGRLDSFSGGYCDMWRKSPDYLGVASRSEFWPFTLINVLVLIAVAWGAFALVENIARDQLLGVGVSFTVTFSVAMVLSIAGIPVLVRRVRDATGSGWLALAGLFPVGWLVLLVVTLLPSRQLPGATPESVAQRTPVPEQREEADPWARGQGGNSGSAE